MENPLAVFPPPNPKPEILDVLPVAPFSIISVLTAYDDNPSSDIRAPSKANPQTLQIVKCTHQQANVS